MPDQTTLPAGSQATTALDSQPVTQFGDYKFPCANHDLESEQRDHIHEWPHRDAGAPEKLGRKLYTCEVTGLFHANMAAFPDLYPGTLNSLQYLFDTGTTALFVHPSSGTFPAYIKKWRRRRDPRVRSGEVVTMVFQEDQQTSFLADDFATSSSKSLASSADALNQQFLAVYADLQAQENQSTLSLFGAIQTLCNDITGVSDTAQMYGNLVGAKAQQLQNLCSQLDGQMDMQDARAFPIVDALHDVWFQSLLITQDQQAKRAKTVSFVVPRPMPLTAISQRLYNGDASHTDDLLAINANIIPDPLRVQAGLTIEFYPE